MSLPWWDWVASGVGSRAEGAGVVRLRVGGRESWRCRLVCSFEAGWSSISKILL